jgi:hypothetical protein
MNNKILSKTTLMRLMDRFYADKNRGISIVLFAELAGVSETTLDSVFRDKISPLTEYVQRRVSKAYLSWMQGEVAVMQNYDRSRFVQYRKEKKPMMRRSMAVTVINGQMKLKVGIKNRADYSEFDIDEKLRGYGKHSS